MCLPNKMVNDYEFPVRDIILVEKEYIATSMRAVRYAIYLHILSLTGRSAARCPYLFSTLSPAVPKVPAVPKIPTVPTVPNMEGIHITSAQHAEGVQHG